MHLTKKKLLPRIRGIYLNCCFLITNIICILYEGLRSSILKIDIYFSCRLKQFGSKMVIIVTLPM